MKSDIKILVYNIDKLKINRKEYYFLYNFRSKMCKKCKKKKSKFCINCLDKIDGLSSKKKYNLKNDKFFRIINDY
jgi:hypothetical protein